MILEDRVWRGCAGGAAGGANLLADFCSLRAWAQEATQELVTHRRLELRLDSGGPRLRASVPSARRSLSAQESSGDCGTAAL